jgi:hypothetical protein
MAWTRRSSRDAAVQVEGELPQLPTRMSYSRPLLAGTIRAASACAWFDPKEPCAGSGVGGVDDAESQTVH